MLNAINVLRWTAGRYTPPTRDAVQNMHNSSVTYDDGMLTLTFQRARNTTDNMDWAFTDTECYYFIFPVGGGPHTSTGISRHTNTPIISSEKICICKTSLRFWKNIFGSSAPNIFFEGMPPNTRIVIFCFVVRLINTLTYLLTITGESCERRRQDNRGATLSGVGMERGVPSSAD